MAVGLHRSRTSGYIVNSDNGTFLKFQYNPPEWANEGGNNFGTIEAPGSPYPVIFYSGGTTSAISLNLDFYQGGSFTGGGCSPSQVMALIGAMASPRRQQFEMIRGSNHFISPPVCLFVWGAERFRFVLQKYRFQRKQFNQYLHTIALTVTLEMLQIK